MTAEGPEQLTLDLSFTLADDDQDFGTWLRSFPLTPWATEGEDQ